MGVEPFLIASTLRVIIGQRLVRKLTTDKEKYDLSRDEQAQLEKIVDAGTVLRALKEEKVIAKDSTWKDIPFYHPRSSGSSSSGFAGRVGIYEVMSVTSTIKELMMKSASDTELEKQARSEGMLTMSEDGIFKAAQGSTTIEEVLRVITE
jgi:type II secretory ATPase GspE/PulE/Tfp pilus assembly ATPase PilB-like protein